MLTLNIQVEKTMSVKGNGIWIEKGKESVVYQNGLKEIGVKKGKEIGNGIEIGVRIVKKKEIVTVAEDQEVVKGNVREGVRTEVMYR